MFPLYKVVSLVVRVFSRPVINYTKKYHSTKNRRSEWLRSFFVYLGNFYHRLESKINRKFLKIESEFAFKPLNQELAIEKGVEFFYETLFFALIISFSLYQLSVAQTEAKQKAAILEQRLQRIENNSAVIMAKLQRIEQMQRYQRTMKILYQARRNIKPSFNIKAPLGSQNFMSTFKEKINALTLKEKLHFY